MGGWAVKAASSCLGVGYAPWAPGSLGSLVGLLVASAAPAGVLLLLTLTLGAGGLLLCRPARAVYGTPDPAPFVLDEVSGQMLALLFLPKSVLVYGSAFILFRLLDVIKPWIIGRIQKLASPLSIMVDDLAAGLAANLALQILTRII